MELFHLKGRRALITGSSQGIGFALAQGLAEAGATLVLNARNAERLEEAAENLRAAGTNVLTLAFDVTEAAATRAAIDGFEAEHGAIDILVNNAGMQHRAPLEDFPADDFDGLMRDQCQRHAVHPSGGRAAYDPARQRPHHQYCQCANRPRPPLNRALHRLERGGWQPYEGHGDRLGEIWSKLQCHRTWLFQHAAERRPRG